MNVKIPKEKLKLLFNDVLRGFSSYYCVKFNTLYLKHFSISDSSDIELQYENYINRAREAGLPTYEERRQFLLNDNLWTRTQEDNIADHQKFLQTLKLTKSKTFREDDLKYIRPQIEEYEQKLFVLEEEKRSLFQYTAEDFASKKINEFYIYSAFFKDKGLNSPLYNPDEFDELEDDELYELVKIYNIVAGQFDDKCLKSIALYPNFFNLFCLSESVYEFFGKPVVLLTNHQAEVYTHGKYFKNLLGHAPKKPPEHLMDDPDGLTEWAESVQNIDQNTAKTGSKSDSSALVGVSAKDREKLGLNDETVLNPLNNLMAMAKAKDGTLNMYEIMSITNK